MKIFFAFGNGQHTTHDMGNQDACIPELRIPINGEPWCKHSSEWIGVTGKLSIITTKMEGMEIPVYIESRNSDGNFISEIWTAKDGELTGVQFITAISSDEARR